MDVIEGVDSVATDPSRADGRAVDARLPLEHALALDEICSSLDPDAKAYIATDSTTLLQAVINRHDTVLASPSLTDEVVVPPRAELNPHPESEPLSASVDRILILEPSTPAEIQPVIEDETGAPHDCLLGNPYSYNRLENRALDAWCRPTRVRDLYVDAGFTTTLTGYHGPRSIVQSANGRLWDALDRPDRRDRYTHRMRAAYREEWLPFVLLACLVHCRARRTRP